MRLLSHIRKLLTMIECQTPERRLEELRARISGHFSVERRLFRAFPDLQLQEGRDVSDAVKTYLQNTFERKK